MPENTVEGSEQLFLKAQESADAYKDIKYGLIDHNCVGGVVTVLNVIQPNIVNKKEWLPWRLDRSLRKQSRVLLSVENFNTSGSADFRKSFSMKGTSSSESTNSTLMLMGFVVADTDGYLIPTIRAPKDFSEGLIYNSDHQSVMAMKKSYKKHSSFFSINSYTLFSDNPTPDVLKQRLFNRAKSNPNGASAKVLNEISVLKSGQNKDKDNDNIPSNDKPDATQPHHR